MQHVTRLLEPVADDAVTIVEELAVLLLSKLALEPQAHAQIAATAAIPVLLQNAVCAFKIALWLNHCLEYLVNSKAADAGSSF